MAGKAKDMAGDAKDGVQNVVLRLIKVKKIVNAEAENSNDDNSPSVESVKLVNL